MFFWFYDVFFKFLSNNHQIRKLITKYMQNREIKFRAWDESQKYMAYQGMPDLENIQSFIFHFGDKILMQYTGLKDFNGKKIFEGDIIEYVPYMHSLLKKTDIIEFNVNCGAWFCKKTAETLADMLVMQHDEEWQIKQNYKPRAEHKVRVIGNIYENPQLLEKSLFF
jgi:uncharacterized phage protein (TIGR01671 family)